MTRIDIQAIEHIYFADFENDGVSCRLDTQVSIHLVRMVALHTVSLDAIDAECFVQLATVRVQSNAALQLVENDGYVADVFHPAQSDLTHLLAEKAQHQCLLHFAPTFANRGIFRITLGASSCENRANANHRLLGIHIGVNE